MAKYRQVHTSFWNDSFVLDLTPEEKYFYLYLMTNDQTTQCGIYELPKRIIEMHTGYNRETVEKLLARFEEYEKIKYHDPTKEIFMTNWAKYNWIKSPKVVSCIDKELKSVKYQGFVKEYKERLKGYGYGIEGLSIDSGEEREEEKEEEEEEKNKDKEIIKNIVAYLNQKSGKNFKASGAKTKTLITARLKDGFKLEDFQKVIDNKVAEWSGGEMDKFIRPETLFGSKFEGYLNQRAKVNVGQHQKQNKFKGDGSYEVDYSGYDFSKPIDDKNLPF